MDAQSLIEVIEADELEYEAPSLYAWKLGAVSDAEGAAQFMFYGGPFPPQASASREQPPQDRRPDRRYWDYVKTEMHVFLCTEEKRYQTLWTQLEELKKKSTTAIVGVIATYMGANIGVAATLLSGFVAVCLYAIIKVGKEAYCKYVARNGA